MRLSCYLALLGFSNIVTCINVKDTDIIMMLAEQQASSQLSYAQMRGIMEHDYQEQLKNITSADKKSLHA